MHQGEPDFALNLFHADVTTLVQHGIPLLADAALERNATLRQPEFKSLEEVSREAGFHMTVSVGRSRSYCWKYHHSLQRVHRIKRRKRKQANRETK